MFKEKIAGLVERKGLRLDPKGESIPGVIPALLYRSQEEIWDY